MPSQGTLGYLVATGVLARTDLVKVHVSAERGPGALPVWHDHDAWCADTFDSRAELVAVGDVLTLTDPTDPRAALCDCSRATAWGTSLHRPGDFDAAEWLVTTESPPTGPLSLGEIRHALEKPPRKACPELTRMVTDRIAALTDADHLAGAPYRRAANRLLAGGFENLHGWTDWGVAPYPIRDVIAKHPELIHTVLNDHRIREAAQRWARGRPLERAAWADALFEALTSITAWVETPRLTERHLELDGLALDYRADDPHLIRVPFLALCSVRDKFRFGLADDGYPRQVVRDTLTLARNTDGDPTTLIGALLATRA